MSSNPYITYYVNQAGSGIGGFQGARFQRGQGFFGNVFKSAILPLLRYFGKQALTTGVDVAKDALSGENILDSIKTRGKRTMRNMASDAATRATKYAQTGTGRRGRKRRRNIKGGSIIRKSRLGVKRRARRTRKRIALF